MTTSQIICPHCQNQISLDDALTSQIRGNLEATLKAEEEARVKALKDSYEKELRDNREKLTKELKQSLTEESAREVTFLKEQMEEEKKKRRLAEDKELELRKKEAKLEEDQRTFQLEMTRKLDSERKLIREQTEHQLIEAQRQKDMEKDKQINDLKKLLEDAQRKANQGSQQTQGEVRELMLEELLRSTFPTDVIEPIGKGVNGADIRQIVRSTGGTICGTILWESKQTKAWQDGWISKLKTDLRSEKADICALVTAVFNEPNWSGITPRDGVWVCSFGLIIPLASLLRKALIDSGYQKAVAAHRGSKAEMLYDYITGTEFRQQLESLAEVFTEMDSQIQKERLVFEKQWKMREAQVKRLSLAATNMVGSIQGFAGQAALPDIKQLELSLN